MHTSPWDEASCPSHDLYNAMSAFLPTHENVTGFAIGSAALHELAIYRSMYRASHNALPFYQPKLTAVTPIFARFKDRVR